MATKREPPMMYPRAWCALKKLMGDDMGNVPDYLSEDGNRAYHALEMFWNDYYNDKIGFGREGKLWKQDGDKPSLRGLRTVVVQTPDNKGGIA